MEQKPHEYLSCSSSYLFLSLEVLQLCFISAGNPREDGLGSYSTSHAVDCWVVSFSFIIFDVNVKGGYI